MGEETAEAGTVAATMTMPMSAVVVVLAGFSADVAAAMISVGMWVSMEHWFSE
jgi:ABC-type multidrug transport system permease subunit